MSYCRQFMQLRRSWVIAVPYKTKKECYFFKELSCCARGMLFSMVEQVFLPVGEVWWMNNEVIKYIEEGRKETKMQRKKNVEFFSCFAIKYEFYFTV